MKKVIFGMLMLLSVISLNAQEQKFALLGKPVVTIFANYHAGLGKSNKDSGFELDRSYLGYEFKLNDELSGKVIFDIGTTKVDGADLERVAYVKNAMLIWKPGKFTLDFGLVKLEHFSLQESFWGYRYILKSFSDEYKFGSSADLGIIGKYKFTDWLAADITFINGEGYKKLNKDNKYRYGAGITLIPLKNLSVRGYFDIYNGNEDDSKAQNTLALFAGYKHSRFSLGAEYNKILNTKFVKDHDKDGFSVYSTIPVAKKIAIFGRYDNLQTSDEMGSHEDGQRILAGLEYRPHKYLKISPDFSNWNPMNGKSESFVYLNVQFKL